MDNYFLEKSFIIMEVLNEAKEPLHYASGCIIEYNNNFYVLTVEHAVKDYMFHLRIKWDKHQRRILFQHMGTFDRLKSANISEFNVKNSEYDNFVNFLDLKNFVDFAYMKVTSHKNKLDNYFQILNPNASGDVDFECKKEIIKTTLLDKPTEGEHCRFAGLVLPMYEKHSKQPIFSHVLQKTEMIYLGPWEEDSRYYKFKSIKPMISHDFYKGCSGSPIFNSKNKIIALVNSGDIDKNEIYGISMETCKYFLDIDNMVYNF